MAVGPPAVVHQLAAELAVVPALFQKTSVTTACAEGMAAVMAMVNTHVARLMEELGAKRLNLEFFIICVF
ncbi:hypothetical protein HQ447_04060 [bacterium]|nr:hypothetical protein [bacterium]